MPTATLASKGQITLPRAIGGLKGLLHRKGVKALSVEATNAVIQRRAAGGR